LKRYGGVSPELRVISGKRHPRDHPERGETRQVAMDADWRTASDGKNPCAARTDASFPVRRQTQIRFAIPRRNYRIPPFSDSTKP
jgi:hypothetical protein